MKEIEHASSILEEAENKKHFGIRLIDKTAYGALLFFLIIGNALCSAFLIPFIFAIKGNFIVMVATILGFAFGVFFSIVMADMQKKNNLKAMLTTLVVSGIVSFALISAGSTQFSVQTALPLPHNPNLIAGIYLFSFLTPHVVLMITQYRKQ